MRRLKNLFLTLLIFLIFSFQALPVTAGPYTDDLTKCIVESTTMTDRIEFVKWMFFAISMHPVAKEYSSVSEVQIVEANKQTANLFMKLITDSCREKAAKAIKYEGQAAFQTSFQMLGQVAAQDLFSDPEVAAVISALEKYIDGDKLKSSLVVE